MAVEVDDSGARVVSGFLQAWSAALAARDVDALAGLFDHTALFTATAPEPLQGQAQIRAYYNKAPPALRVQATPSCATHPLPGLVHGIADVAFDAPGGVVLRGRLGLSLVLRPQGWRVSAYQLSVSTPA
jgi:ketosteroid isomerase-like protein